MYRLILFTAPLAAVMVVSAPAAARQERVLPGVHVVELTVELPDGETARGAARLASPEARPLRALAPNAGGRVPATASIEVEPGGALLRSLRRAHDQQLGFRASFSGRDAAGRHVITSVRHTYITAIRPTAAGAVVLDLGTGGAAAPAISCSAAACTGPAADFLFLYHCVVNGHGYVTARGGGRQATCALRR